MDVKPKKKSDNTYCCVPQCATRASDYPELSFHKFPSESDIRQKQWIVALKIGKPVTRRMKVCSRHFDKNDYFKSLIPAKRPHLKRYAVPSRHLPSSEAGKVKRTSVKNRRKEREAAEEKACTAIIIKISSEKLNERDIDSTSFSLEYLDVS